MIPVFHGTVSMSGTRLQADGAEAVDRLRWLKTLAGKRVELTIREARTQRSLDQNAYWHAIVFPLISEFTGYTIPETKLVLMGECFGWQKVAGHEVPIKPSTSDLTTAEGSQFTEWVIPWAVEHCDGLQIPLPGQCEAA